MNKLINFNRIWNKIKDRNNARETKIFKYSRARNKVKNDHILITFPKNIFVIYLENLKKSYIYIYIYDKTYSFLFIVDYKKILYLKFYNDTKTIFIYFNKTYKFTSLGCAHIYKFIHIFHSMFIKRVRVRGRLYRIYKRNVYRDMMYRFGHTHKVTVYTEGLYTRYIRKKRIRLFGYDFYYLINKTCEIRDWFPINVYTQRGITRGGDRVRAKIGKTIKYY